MLIPVLLILLLLAEPILLIHELSENTLKNKLIGECCADRKYENEWNNNPCISDTTSITMTNNVHGRLAIRMSIVFLRVIFVTCSNREIYADVYMAQAAAISAIMMNTMEKVPH